MSDRKNINEPLYTGIVIEIRCSTFQILMSVEMHWMTVMKSMAYVVIPMGPTTVAAKWGTVVMESHAQVCEPVETYMYLTRTTFTIQ